MRNSWVGRTHTVAVFLSGGGLDEGRVVFLCSSLNT